MGRYKIVSLDEAYDLLNGYGTIKWTNRPLSFTFDIRKRVSESERECKNKWYAFQYVEVTDILIVLGVSYYKDDLETAIEISKEATIDFMKRYCEKYCQDFKGKICIDIDDWEESDPIYKQIQSEWNERGLLI